MEGALQAEVSARAAAKAQHSSLQECVISLLDSLQQEHAGVWQYSLGTVSLWGMVGQDDANALTTLLQLGTALSSTGCSALPSNLAPACRSCQGRRGTPVGSAVTDKGAAGVCRSIWGE